jgi:hypothetical protein
MDYGQTMAKSLIPKIQIPIPVFGYKAPKYLVLKWGSKLVISIGQWGMFNHEKGAI